MFLSREDIQGEEEVPLAPPVEPWWEDPKPPAPSEAATEEEPPGVPKTPEVDEWHDENPEGPAASDELPGKGSESGVAAPEFVAVAKSKSRSSRNKIRLTWVDPPAEQSRPTQEASFGCGML